MILYCIIFSHYTFSWPEDGPQWPKHVVSLIKQIQRQLCFDVPTPFLICTKHKGDDAAKDATGCASWEAFGFRQRPENDSACRNIQIGSDARPAAPLQCVTELRRSEGEDGHLSPPSIPSLRMSRAIHAISHMPSRLAQGKIFLYHMSCDMWLN